jgi:hypothetical protein
VEERDTKKSLTWRSIKKAKQPGQVVMIILKCSLHFSSGRNSYKAFEAIGSAILRVQMM